MNRRIASALFAITVSVIPAHTFAQTISLNASNTFQTFSSWEVLSTRQEDQHPNIDNYYDELATRVADLGINRIRVESHTERERVEVINDNNDPSVVDWNGFDFSAFDADFEKIVLPLKEAVEATGGILQINLCLVTVGSKNDVFHKLPEEYAEFILAHFLHLDAKYGVVPDYVEAALEPRYFSVFDKNPTKLAKALIAAGDRLAEAGFFPSFIAPSSTKVSWAKSWFDTMIQVPRISQYWKEYSHHLYGSWSDHDLQDIGIRAENFGLGSSMLEWWKSDNNYTVLHRELKLANITAWHQGSMTGRLTDPGFTNWSAQHLFYVDNTNPSNPQFVMNPKTKFYSMYYRFIRPGAVRIEATSTNGSLDPIAFINSNGFYTVIVKADNAASFSITGLPPGQYGIRYTTNLVYDVANSDKTISTGQTLSTSIPGRGVITIFTHGGALETAHDLRIENVTP